MDCKQQPAGRMRSVDAFFVARKYFSNTVQSCVFRIFYLILENTVF
jgi:hypothetical protein